MPDPPAAPPDRPPPRPAGRVRYPLVLLGMVALAGAVYLARNPDALGRPGAGALREGAGEASALREPDDLLAWLLANPERVSLVVYDVGAEGEGVSLNPNDSRPIAALPTLLLAAGYALEVEAGLHRPDEPVAPSALARRRLPGLDRAGPADTSALTLDGVARRALRGERAAADELLDRVGRSDVEALPARLGLPDLEAPLPLGGLLLSWAPAGRGLQEDPAAQAAAFARLPPAARRDSAFARDLAFRNSESYRSLELARGGLPIGPDEQRAAAAATFPRGTAAGYARLLADALGGRIGSGAASDRFLGLIAGPLPPDATAGLSALGYVGGGFRGLVAGAGFARTAGRPRGRVAVLLVQDVPDAVFHRLTQNGQEVGLLYRLLTDDAYFARAREQAARALGAHAEP